jgi:hypothetical protein
MNYGWADLDPQAPPLPLQPEDGVNRYCIQLYHRVATPSTCAAWTSLRGGQRARRRGASCRALLRPRSLTGMDLTRESVEFCQPTLRRCPQLRFVQGDAENLPFDPQAFDAVINVSRRIATVPWERFHGRRAPRCSAGRYFLYTDHREQEPSPPGAAPAGVGPGAAARSRSTRRSVRALEAGRRAQAALIARKVPRWLRRLFNEFAGISGTRSSYAALRDGDKVYLRMVLRRGG